MKDPHATYRINIPVPRWVFLLWTYFLDRPIYNVVRQREAELE